MRADRGGNVARRPLIPAPGNSLSLAPLDSSLKEGAKVGESAPLDSSLNEGAKME